MVIQKLCQSGFAGDRVLLMFAALTKIAGFWSLTFIFTMRF
jgi:hypothetical protein